MMFSEHHTCPNCTSRMDSATTGYDDPPQVGRWVICWYCAAVLSFGEKAMMLADMSEATPEEISEVNDMRQTIIDRRLKVEAQ